MAGAGVYFPWLGNAILFLGCLRYVVGIFHHPLIFPLS